MQIFSNFPLHSKVENALTPFYLYSRREDFTKNFILLISNILRISKWTFFALIKNKN